MPPRRKAAATPTIPIPPASSTPSAPPPRRRGIQKNSGVFSLQSSKPPPLDGCTIALSGTFPGGSTQPIIEKDFLAPLGASLVKSVTASTTCLVASETDYNKPSVKVQTAKTNNVPIVTFQWLHDCLGQMLRLDESKYSHDSTAQPQVNESRKRSATKSSTDDAANAQPEQPKKKARATRAGSRHPSVGKTTDDADADTKDNQPKQPEKKADAVKEEPQKKEVKVEKEAKVAEGQIAKSLDAKIPLDEGSDRVYPGYEVYIDDGGVIYDASLNQTNASNNNNKFYRLQLLRSVFGDYRVWTRWGRVGEYGQTKSLGNGTLDNCLREFDSKFKSKSGLSWEKRNEAPKPNKYAFIERSYEPDSEDEDEDDDTKDVKAEAEPEQPEPESKLPKPVQDLMQLIFNQQYFAATMAELNYDSAKLPLGKLSTSTINKGFQALKDLSALLDDNSLAASQYNTTFANATEQLSNLFFTLIPHNFGRLKPPVIQTNAMLKKEIELLESLGDMKYTALLMKAKSEKKELLNQLDRQFQGLGLNEMTPLDKTTQEFTQIRDYLMNTRGATHNAKYQIREVFRIERQGEIERFDAAHKAPRNRRLLWHGSRCTNFGGILSQGLRIAPPEAPVNGYMFGKGIYLADMSSKSANYCCAYNTNGHALLLLCEAELGDPMQELTNASYNAGEEAKAKGMLSTLGQGTTGPSLWKDAECIHPSLKGVKIPDTSVMPGDTNVQYASLLYNEYICYDISQVRLRYLLRVRM
ncbi:poly polymerase catalytic domain-containing protein [Camillea tinctor]|nr:poly polymerase catalytic domain-containing protein [Camillea tinctor]